jgi:hypothetical protein
MCTAKTIAQILADHGYKTGPSPFDQMKCVWSKAEFCGFFRAGEVLHALGLPTNPNKG